MTTIYPQATHQDFFSPHMTNNIQFFVDDFGANFFGKHNSDNLINGLKTLRVTIDWNGQSFCGIKFKWYYDKKDVNLSMPN